MGKETREVAGPRKPCDLARATRATRHAATKLALVSEIPDISPALGDQTGTCVRNSGHFTGFGRRKEASTKPRTGFVNHEALEVGAAHAAGSRCYGGTSDTALSLCALVDPRRSMDHPHAAPGNPPASEAQGLRYAKRRRHFLLHPNPRHTGIQWVTYSDPSQRVPGESQGAASRGGDSAGTKKRVTKPRRTSGAVGAPLVLRGDPGCRVAHGQRSG